MLFIPLYYGQKNIFNLTYLRSKEKVFVITPSPSSADLVREKIGGHDSDRVDVITMSEFLRSNQGIEGGEKEKWRKSKILKNLATVWKKFNSKLPQGAFFQAFLHITDLRSHTLNKELIADLLDEYGEDMGQMLSLLWDMFDQLDIYDEQKAYADLAVTYRENPEIFKDKNIIFYGFDFLNPSQIDLLHSLAIANDVFVPLPKEVYEQSIPSDWVRWINGELIEIDQKKELKEVKAKLILYEKNRMAEVLNAQEFDKKDAKINVFLCESNPNINQIREIPIPGLSYKVSASIFNDRLHGLFEEFADRFIGHKTQDLIWDIKRRIEEWGPRDSFSLLKIYKQIESELEEWNDLSVENEVVTLFDLEVLKQVISLNLPRTFLTPHLEQYRGRLSGLESILGLSEDIPSLVIASSSYRPVKGRDNPYSEKMMELLSAISPVPRVEFQSYFITGRLKNILESPEITFLVERDLYASDPFWGEFLRENKLSLSNQNLTPRRAIDLLILDKEIAKKIEQKELLPPKHISASRLQSYLDCPRKYFFSYLYNFNIFTELPVEMSAAEIGRIEHQCIKEVIEYQLKTNEFNATERIVKKALDDFSLGQRKNFTKLQREKYIFEVTKAVDSGLRQLHNLGIDPKNMQFEIDLGEMTFQGHKVRGEVDFFGLENGETSFLLDFKRSSWGVSGRSDILSYSSLQLWFYLYFMKENIINLNDVFLGYICLMNPEDSLILSTNQAKGGKKYLENIESLLSQFEVFLADLIEKIKNDRSFCAKPRDVSVCRTCHMANVCDRGVSG